MNALLASTTRQERRALAKSNAHRPLALVRVPREEWPEWVAPPPGLTELWRSRNFLVQVFTHEDATRLSVCRTEVRGDRFRGDITWEDLQRLKRECGRGDQCAVELFPPDSEVVNVANMRHLWLVPAPSFMWCEA